MAPLAQTILRLGPAQQPGTDLLGVPQSAGSKRLRLYGAGGLLTAILYYARGPPHRTQGAEVVFEARAGTSSDGPDTPPRAARERERSAG